MRLAETSCQVAEDSRKVSSLRPHLTTTPIDLVGFLVLELSIPPPEEDKVGLGRKFLLGSTEESCDVEEKKKVFEG